MKIYVASSWRNSFQHDVVEFLRNSGHDVYDFRHPEPGNTGFQWSEIESEWRHWSAQAFIAALDHPIARRGFALDMDALRACDACVLVLPSGKSAHLEAGWAAGAGKRVVIYMPDRDEPELMYSMVHRIVRSLSEVQVALEAVD